MSRTSLPASRNRWRSAAAGIAIAMASFTVAACGEEPVEDEGVVEEGGVGEEDD
jgi:hypothetical protein